MDRRAHLSPRPALRGRGRLLRAAAGPGAAGRIVRGKNRTAANDHCHCGGSKADDDWRQLKITADSRVDLWLYGNGDADMLSGGAGALRDSFTPGGLHWVNRLSGLIIAFFGVAAMASLLAR